MTYKFINGKLDTPLIAVSRAIDAKLGAESTRSILKHKVDMEARDGYGKTALLNAVSNEGLETVQALIEAKADLQVQDDDKSTALMCLVSNPECSLEMAQALIQAKAAPINSKGKVASQLLTGDVIESYVESLRDRLLIDVDIDKWSELAPPIDIQDLLEARRAELQQIRVALQTYERQYLHSQQIDGTTIPTLTTRL